MLERQNVSYTNKSSTENELSVVSILVPKRDEVCGACWCLHDHRIRICLCGMTVQYPSDRFPISKMENR